MKGLIAALLLLIAIRVDAQNFLSQIEMTASGGQPYDEFYWLNSANASLTKTGVTFESTGTYRIDLSVKDVIASPNLAIEIDGSTVANMNIPAGYTTSGSPIKIYSVLTSSIAAGTHTLAIQLTNFNNSNNYLKVGLIYITRTSKALPDTFPSITTLPLVWGQYLRSNHYASGQLRGFNLGSNGNNQAGETPQAMEDMVATGANIARCFVAVTRVAGSNTYTLKPGELTKLDTTVARAARMHYYVIPALELDPSFNGGHGNADLWGPTSLGANQGLADSFVQRQQSVLVLWQFLARRYKKSTEVGGYDLWNEPRGLYNYALYLRWQKQISDSIRAIDPNHVIIIECLHNDMFAMMLPFADTFYVYSPHGYSSLHITHQGVPGAGEKVSNIYPANSGTANLPAPWGITQLSAQHDNVRTLANRFHVPVFAGEFSCINWAPINSSGEWTSTKWVDDNISLLEAEGWSWAYHTWRGDYIGWEAEIPSEWYAANATFTDAFPSVRPPRSVRSGTAPTITVLKNYFRLNTGTYSRPRKGMAEITGNGAHGNTGYINDTNVISIIALALTLVLVLLLSYYVRRNRQVKHAKQKAGTSVLK